MLPRSPRNASGELFVFERTLWIINFGAASIAQAAKDFGQDDDITVLSITRAASEDGGPQGEIGDHRAIVR